ncbi:MAG: right-handed parallel beta-helix repeat-containing protein [Candidatus Pacearchaeota archaeon]|nr:right-handed parallel beta-helix repeat-containing protein [Candidatus Pacearchaeota archaeon]
MVKEERKKASKLSVFASFVFVLLVVIFINNIVIVLADTEVTGCHFELGCGRNYLTRNLNCGSEVDYGITVHSLYDPCPRMLDCQGHSIIYGGYTKSNAGVWIYSNDVAIKNCSLQGWDVGIYINNGQSPNVTIENNVISDSKMHGIQITSCEKGGYLITQNKITDAGENGIFLVDCVNTNIIRNLIINAKYRGIYLWGSKADNNIVSYNVIKQTPGQGGVGIVLRDDGAMGNTIKGNYIDYDKAFVADRATCMQLQDSSGNGCDQNKVDCNGKGNFQCLYSPTRILNSCLSLYGSQGYRCSINPETGSNFDPSLKNTFFPLGNECLFVGLSKEAIDCTGKLDSYKTCKNNKVYDCNGCGGNHKEDCGTKKVCRNGACVEITNPIVVLISPENNTRVLEGTPTDFKCDVYGINEPPTYVTLYGSWGGGRHAERIISPGLEENVFENVILPKTGQQESYIWSCVALIREIGSLVESEKNTLIVSPLPGPVCGNNIIEPLEICDGSNLSGKTCLDFGYTGGSLSCHSDCLSYDLSGCTNNQQPRICICNSCLGCKQNLTDPSCITVNLTSNINTNDERCLDYSFNNKVFDCQGHTINGTRGFYTQGGAIDFHGTSNATVKNCIINHFYYGLLLGGSNNIIFNNIINNSFGSGIYLRNAMNNSILNNTIINAGSSGIRSILSKSTINNNKICNNTYIDFLSGDYFPDWFGSTGDNNFCDKPDGWNDTGTTGCTKTCGLSRFVCNITNANILDIYCTGESGSCKVGNNITINISVENMTACTPDKVNKIELNATEILDPEHPNGDPCKVSLRNSTYIRKTYGPGFGGSFYSNWTISSISQKCAGRDMNVTKAALYNGTNSANQIGEKIGSFGTFVFAGAPVPFMFNLSLYTCGDENLNGKCENFTINGAVSVNGTPWGKTPKWKMTESGWENISFGDASPWYKPSDILLNLIEDTNYTGIYTKDPMNNATIIVFARNEEGEFINALIRIWNESRIVASGNNETKYEYDGNFGWPAVFTIEFRNVASYYTTPGNISFSLTGNGIYIFNGIYQSSGNRPCFCDDGTLCGSCIGDGTGRFCEAESATHGRFMFACDSHGCTCNSAHGTCITDPTKQNYNKCAGGGIDVCHDMLHSNSPGNCQGNNNQFTCFWDLGRNPPLNDSYHCERCFAVNGTPISCSNYINRSACEKTTSPLQDACEIGSGCPGAPSGAYDCNCIWKANACQLSFNLSSGGGSGGSQACTLNLTVEECSIGACGTNKKMVIYQYSNATNPGTCFLPDQTSCVRCGVETERMPFFAPWQILIVLGLLAAYYSFFIIKKKKRIINII